MNSISFIALDLDGTLLKSDHSISKYTVDVLKKLVDKNIMVVPTTGRPLSAVLDYVPVDLCDYIICTNGVHLYHKNGDNFTAVWDKSMDWTTAKRVLEIKESAYPKIHTHCYIGDSLFTISSTLELDEYTSRTGIQVTMLSSWNNLIDKNVAKVMFVSDHEKLTDLQGMIKNAVDSVTPTFSMLYYLEVFSNQASKSNALAHVMKQLSIPQANALAIGDSYNDESMLTSFENAYVMKNAPDTLLSHLPRTDYTNDEDGVAKLLDTLILQNN